MDESELELDLELDLDFGSDMDPSKMFLQSMQSMIRWEASVIVIVILGNQF
jgi:hypothetical protein